MSIFSRVSVLVEFGRTALKQQTVADPLFQAEVEAICYAPCWSHLTSAQWHVHHMQPLEQPAHVEQACRVEERRTDLEGGAEQQCADPTMTAMDSNTHTHTERERPAGQSSSAWI